MSFRSRLRSLWRNVAHRDRVERDLDHELRAAFALLVDEHLRKGAPPAEARRAAMLQLGRIDSIKTQVRDVRGGAGVETLWHDIRFSLRLLGRNRSFTAAAIVSLALGMGANATVFGLLNALRLRSLPVAHAGELAEVQLSGPRCCRHTGRNRQVPAVLWLRHPVSRRRVRHAAVEALGQGQWHPGARLGSALAALPEPLESSGSVRRDRRAPRRAADTPQ